MDFQCECSPKMNKPPSESWSARMPQGLDLEITHHPLTMRQVVNLVIAIDRLKDSKSALSSEFKDEDLLNILLESVVEEQLVLELTSAAPTEMQTNFIKKGEHQCRIVDTQNRNLIMVADTRELNAVRLQGGSSDFEVNLNMSTYVHLKPSTEGRPVALSIRGTNLYLSCSKEAGKPTLHIEEVQNTEELRSISKDSDNVRFLFYKSDTALNISTLMSARYYGWYISTAKGDNLPVDMCQSSASRYQTFKIQS